MIAITIFIAVFQHVGGNAENDIKFKPQLQALARSLAAIGNEAGYLAALTKGIQLPYARNQWKASRRISESLYLQIHPHKSPEQEKFPCRGFQRSSTDRSSERRLILLGREKKDLEGSTCFIPKAVNRLALIGAQNTPCMKISKGSP